MRNNITTIITAFSNLASASSRDFDHHSNGTIALNDNFFVETSHAHN